MKSSHYLILQSITSATDGFFLNFLALKNERFQNKEVPIPTSRLLNDDALCAATAQQPRSDGRPESQAPLLSYKRSQKAVALTSTKFNRTPRKILRHAGFEQTLFLLLHPPRCTTFAGHISLPKDFLKAQGNQKSECTLATSAAN